MSHDKELEKIVTTAENEKEAYTAAVEYLNQHETMTTWTNHWDFHPQDHGGCYIKIDGEYLDVIVTTPPNALPEGMVTGSRSDSAIRSNQPQTDCEVDNEHMVEEFSIILDQDVWNMGELINYSEKIYWENPLYGFTDDMKEFADQYSAGGGPESPFDVEFIKSAAFDFESYYGAYYLGGRDNYIDDDEYWNYLERKGIPVEEFQ